MMIIETCPECGHDLVDLVLTTYPPIPQKKCFNCGWEWTGEREEVVRVPFGGNTYTSDRTYLFPDWKSIPEVQIEEPLSGYSEPSCEYCSNNPRNGGSGICHCILGSS